jgi:CDP-diacylglycerol--glycerol-3-phosphate 3-phosphatidyltransferase
MWTLPNIITIVRICFTPVIALLPFIEGYWPKLICFVVFVIAAVSDVFDGWLARSRGEVTDLGKLLDPLADKLLLFATLVPIYWISRTRHDLYDIPYWGSLPLWVTLLLIGRELAMTAFRHWAQRRGVIIPAHGAGKLKAVLQNVFVGAIILWFAFRDARRPMGWVNTPFGTFWNSFHGGFVAVTLAIATLLTVYSFVVYIYRYRSLISGSGAGGTGGSAGGTPSHSPTR